MKSVKAYNEQELLQRVAEGDETAFRTLFHHWQGLLSGYVFRITESKQQTEEIVQDVFLKIWMTREALSEIQSFKHYLLVISRNKSFDVMKKLLREEKRKQLARDEMVNQVKTDDEAEFDAMTANLIDQAIDNLPPRRKEVYLLSRHQRLTYQEIAGQLNISRESVKTHLKLAGEAITKFIKDNLVNILIVMIALLKK